MGYIALLNYKDSCQIKVQNMLKQARKERRKGKREEERKGEERKEDKRKNGKKKNSSPGTEIPKFLAPDMVVLIFTQF